MKNRKNHTAAKCLSLSALLMFVSATFQIAAGHLLIGAIFFGSAACFLAAAGNYRKKGPDRDDP